MSNVISIKDYRAKKGLDDQDLEYKAKILGMSHIELLEEMVAFEDEKSKVGYISRPMLVRGIDLYTSINKRSETAELREVSKSILRHLRNELSSLYANPRVKNE